MGSVYWQLNDCWPVASWSSIDYYGRYKALHYFAKKFYQGVSLGLFNENGKITINIANETLSDFKGYIKVGIIKNDLIVIFEDKKDVSVSSLTSSDACAYGSDLIENSRDTYFYCELYNENNEILARNTELGTPPKHFKFLNPNISVSVKKENGVAQISLKASAFAKNVEVSFKNHDIALSDNYFDLINDTPYTIFAKTDLTENEILNEISLMSVYDIAN
jgi:beta-mannosidase